MASDNPFQQLPIGELFETLLPDFVLAFAFFTALAYSVLGKRFGHQRAAITVSATVGSALAVGLVWWEQSNGLSVRNLGPIAVGFAIILVAVVMYQATRQVGGSWAGAGIALGAALLISTLLGLDWALDPQVLHTAMTVALVVGILAFLMHRNWHVPPLGARHASLPDVRHDMRDLKQGRKLSDLLRRRLHGLENKAKKAHDEPADAQDILRQLQRMLPAEGWLTERLAQLRAKAYRMRQGHVARLDEVRELVGTLPAEAKKKLSAQLRDVYRELGLDTRMGRLDRAAAQIEKRVRELTRAAQQAAAAYDFRKLSDLLKAAEKLQRQNTNLFKIIERTEKRLLAAARKAAKGTGVVSGS
ncbi:hypothetical protein ACFL09_04000 [Planctomycetota bacterium]